MTAVKICGITNLEDAALAQKLGAASIGLNFWRESPRYVEPKLAREITASAGIRSVGVFVDPDFDNVIRTARIVGLDAIQLHGDETPEFALEIKRETALIIIKAFRVSADFDPEAAASFPADSVLLDAYVPSERGGTGHVFDWQIASTVKKMVPRLYLAGGIASNNVADAISRVNPFAIDVCSGVEGSKGKKDPKKMHALFSAIKQNNELRA